MSAGYAAGYARAQRAEENRQREYRTELAALRSEVRQLTTQAEALQEVSPALKVSVVIDEPAPDSSSDELARYVSKIRALVSNARQDVHIQTQEAWVARLRLSLPGDNRGSARVQLADQRARSTAAARFHAERVANVTTTAKAEFVTNAGRCVPAELPELGRLAEELPDGDVAAAASLSRKVAASIERRKRHLDTEAVRARLLVLVEQTPATERATLRKLARTARDPETVRPQIDEAVARQDQARDRAIAATSLAGALREIGCEVGTDFGTYLADTRSAIAGLRGYTGYGVRVAFTASGLETRVVRRADIPGLHDDEAEVTVCAGLDRVIARMTADGIALETLHRVEPGPSRVPVVTAERWTAEYRPPEAESDQWQGAEDTELRELHHDR